MPITPDIKAIVRAVGDAIPPDGKRDYYRLHRHRFEALLAAIPAGGEGRRVLEVGVNPGLFT